MPSGNGRTLNNYFVPPKSRGSVTLSNDKAYGSPAVDPHYIADKHHLEMTV